MDLASVCRERMMQGKNSGLMLVRQLLLHADDNRRCSCCPQCQPNHNIDMRFSFLMHLFFSGCEAKERHPSTDPLGWPLYFYFPTFLATKQNCDQITNKRSYKRLCSCHPQSLLVVAPLSLHHATVAE